MNYREIDTKTAFDTLHGGSTPVNALLFDALSNELICEYEDLPRVHSSEEFKELIERLQFNENSKYVKLRFYKKIRATKGISW